SSARARSSPRPAHAAHRWYRRRRPWCDAAGRPGRRGNWSGPRPRPAPAGAASAGSARRGRRPACRGNPSARARWRCAARTGPDRRADGRSRGRRSRRAGRRAAPSGGSVGAARRWARACLQSIAWTRRFGTDRKTTPNRQSMAVFFGRHLNIPRRAAMHATDDLRIRAITPLGTPAEIMRDCAAGDAAMATVDAARRAMHGMLCGSDDRLAVVIGPCSIHDPRAALEYAARLAPLRRELGDALEIVMRVYFEKPRTTVGWKGLINDPDLDGSF